MRHEQPIPKSFIKSFSQRKTTKKHSLPKTARNYINTTGVSLRTSMCILNDAQRTILMLLNCFPIFFLSLSVVTESNQRRLTACLSADRFERTPAVAFVWTANRLNKVFVFLLRTHCGDADSMRRGLALPKRGAAEAVNAARLEISVKRLARFAWNFCLAAERVGDRFGLNFLASFFVSRLQHSVGIGAKPRI